MRKFFANVLVGMVAVASIAAASSTLAPAPVHAAKCSNAAFFVLPTWYRGLGQNTTLNGRDRCIVDVTKKDGVTITWQEGVITIALNVLDGLLRLAGLLAVVFVIIGGVRYIISQGEPAGITAAKGTIVRAVIGLAIAISSSLILNFIAGSIFGLTVNDTNYQVNGSGNGNQDFNGGDAQ